MAEKYSYYYTKVALFVIILHYKGTLRIRKKLYKSGPHCSAQKSTWMAREDRKNTARDVSETNLFLSLDLEFVWKQQGVTKSFSILKPPFFLDKKTQQFGEVITTYLRCRIVQSGANRSAHPWIITMHFPRSVFISNRYKYSEASK